MRFSWLLLGLLLSTQSIAAQEMGGHPVALQVWAGYLALNETIRFDGDVLFEVGAAYGVSDWMEIALAISQTQLWDRRREQWGNSVGFSMHGNIWPLALQGVGLGGFAGVSFMGFEEGDDTDAIAEGLDLGIAWRRRLGKSWQLRIGALTRLQNFNIVEVDADGVPLGTREERRYLWSKLLRAGLSHEF